MLLVWLFTAWLSPSELSAPDWTRREAAEARCRSCGPFAVPFLMPLLRSDDPEARQRAETLTRPTLALLRDAATVRAWLEAPGLTGDAVKELFADPRARYAVAQTLRRMDLLTYEESVCLINGFAPDVVQRFVMFMPPYATAYALLDFARARWKLRKNELLRGMCP